MAWIILCPPPAFLLYIQDCILFIIYIIYIWKQIYIEY